MKSYEVRLKREVTQASYTTVSVTAETEEAAIAQAINHAQSTPDEWSGKLVEPASFGSIEILTVEEIVDLDAAE